MRGCPGRFRAPAAFQGYVDKAGTSADFQDLGVTEVMVAGDQQVEDIPDMDVDPEIIKQVTAVMEHLYQHVDRSHPAMKELFWISIDYRSRRSVIEEKPRMIGFEKGDALKLQSGDLRKKLI